MKEKWQSFKGKIGENKKKVIKIAVITVVVVLIALIGLNVYKKMHRQTNQTL